MRKLFTLILYLIFTVSLWAQPSNDDCENAIMLTDVVGWCSERAEFTNMAATESPDPSPMCFPNNSNNLDVWYSFIAEANTANVSVVGTNMSVTPGGTLANPQLAIYEGSCGALNELVCASDAFNNHQVSVFVNNLQIGQTYYIRVSARFDFMGTFQLCINNYNEVPAPSGDCEPGVVLCDKSPFSVDFVNGEGNDINEIDNVSCNVGGCDITEASSSWYKWTCDQSGTLSFSINPLNPIDDIDFVVYELPNGIDDCSGKFDLRCMASGENVGATLNEWIACMGDTGLSLSDTDISETCGCQSGDNNYVAALNMVAGRSYALVINNFSQSGNGFSIEFGGTGTFLGPNADFTAAPDEVCVGEAVTYEDASTFIGNIVGQAWNFGPYATPAIASGPGPHSVVYHRPGPQFVTLTVETERGCFVTEVREGVNVVCCSDHFTLGDDVSDVLCAGDSTGAIDMSVNNAYGPYIYEWSNNENTQDIDNLPVGIYSVTITDQATCQTVQSYEVNSPAPLAFDTLITMPTCNGGTDGAIEMVVTGGIPDYLYSWENGPFQTNNTLNNLSNGRYQLTVRDDNNCEQDFDIDVHELILLLDPTVQTITPPSCTGFDNASIQVVIDNGLPTYQYDWNDGNGYVDENSLSGLTSGLYQVDVLDANLCQGHFDLEVIDPLPLALNFDVTDVSCYGDSDGDIEVTASGGVGGYAYNWGIGSNATLIDDLPVGTYPITVTDANDCIITASPIVNQPDPLVLEVENVIDNPCFGYQEGQIRVLASGGVMPFEYSINNGPYQIEPTFTALAAGNYILSVLDVNGCIDTTASFVTEPTELLVDAGADQFIDLGYTTTAEAITNYPDVSFTWNPLDSLDCLNVDCSNVFLNPTSTTNYQVTVVNQAGCFAVDQLVIHVVKNKKVFIPNVFSPNDDGINDYFTIFAKPDVRRIKKLSIYDRWGELIYEGKDIIPNVESLGWDGTFNGKPMNSGVFVFVAEVEFIDNGVELFKGDVTIVY